MALIDLNSKSLISKLFGRYLTDRQRKIIGVIAGLILTVLVVQQRNISLHTFSTDRWIDYGVERRLMMVDDLVAKYTLEGLSETQIKELLGEPDEVADGKMYYLLPDPQVFTLTLEDGTVVSYAVEER